MMLHGHVDWESDMDDLTEYAAVPVLVAFHFMLRSSEYCARLKAGKFDLDRVLRLMDIVLTVFLLKEGKSPVTRAMLFALCKELDWETNSDDLVKYAAALAAFHFMLRSAEYCARLTGGRSDLDISQSYDPVRHIVPNCRLVCSAQRSNTSQKQIRTFGGKLTSCESASRIVALVACPGPDPRTRGHLQGSTGS